VIRPKVCLEATPEYLLDARAARRVAAALPDTRIIALVRNPVDRAVSHYLLMRRLGFERLSFDEAIEQEEDRLAMGMDELAHQPNGPLPARIRHYSYMARGRYSEQLERWFTTFAHNRILVVRSEDLFWQSAATLRIVTAFLGLTPGDEDKLDHTRYRQERPRSALPVTPGRRERMQAHFEPWNRQLEAMLGRAMNW
jgi:hypothetical protein